MSSLPTQTSPVYCTDEDILVHAADDFGILCPAWQQMAAGTDGVFVSGSPWILTSASVDFEANGIAPNQVVWLTAPKSQYPGGGHYLAIDSVSTNSITLRRAYKASGVGMPPAPQAGLSGVVFTINTLDPQSAEAAYEIKQRYAIDDNPVLGIQRATQWIYDVQVLRQAAVYWVLVDRYVQAMRSERGDFAQKANKFRSRRDDALDRVQVRWGPYGNSAAPTTLFNTKIAR